MYNNNDSNDDNNNDGSMVKQQQNEEIKIYVDIWSDGSIVRNLLDQKPKWANVRMHAKRMILAAIRITHERFRIGHMANGQ